MRRFVSTLIILGLFLPLLVIGASGDFCNPTDDSSPLIKVPCLFKTQLGPAGAASFGSLVIITIQIALLVVGAIAVAYLIWGGFQYITASGNEEQGESAKKTIKHSILGLFIVLLSFTLITLLTRVLITGAP